VTRGVDGGGAAAAGPVATDEGGGGPWRVEPATGECWGDLERLFGERGACGGCWCMHWRLPAAEYESGKGEENRRRLRERMGSEPTPGVIAYLGDEPVGWCAVAPRSEYRRMERSRILAPVDDEPVWSIVCFFVARAHRGRGLSVALIQGAVDLAAAHGASIAEAYPVEPKTDSMPPVFAFTGLASAFRRAGFREVERRSPTRPIVRMEL